MCAHALSPTKGRYLRRAAYGFGLACEKSYSGSISSVAAGSETRAARLRLGFFILCALTSQSVRWSFAFCSPFSWGSEEAGAAAGTSGNASIVACAATTVGWWEKGTVIQNGATDTLLRLLMDMPDALLHLLNKRGIVSAIFPLVPMRRSVSYQYPVILPGPRMLSDILTVTSREATDLDTSVPVQQAEFVA